MKLLWRIDIFGFKLFLPMIQRICKVTGHDSEHVAHALLNIGTFGIVVALITESVLQHSGWSVWYGFLAWLWMNTRKELRNRFKRLAAQWQTSNGMVPIEFFRLAEQRVIFTVVTVFIFIIGAIAPSALFAVFAVGHLLVTVALYAGSVPMNGGKKLSERIKDLARNTVEKLRDLVPQPALQPIPVR